MSNTFFRIRKKNEFVPSKGIDVSKGKQRDVTEHTDECSYSDLSADINCNSKRSLLTQARPLNDQDLATPVQSKTTVTFGYLEMRQYPIILGDHPDCSIGPPIALGWNYDETEPVKIDSFEDRRKPRRQRDDLYLEWSTRERMLRRCVRASNSDMHEAVTEVKRVQKQRAKTVASLRFVLFFESLMQSFSINRRHPAKAKTKTPKRVK